MPEITPVAEIRSGDIVMLTGERWETCGMQDRIVTVKRGYYSNRACLTWMEGRVREFSLGTAPDWGVLLLHRPGGENA